MIKPRRSPVVGERCACVCTKRGYLRRPLGGARGAAGTPSRRRRQAAQAIRHATRPHVRKQIPRAKDRRPIRATTWKTSDCPNEPPLLHTNAKATQYKQGKPPRSPDRRGQRLRKRFSVWTRGRTPYFRG